MTGTVFDLLYPRFLWLVGRMATKGTEVDCVERAGKQGFRIRRDSEEAIVWDSDIRPLWDAGAYVFLDTMILTAAKRICHSEIK